MELEELKNMWNEYDQKLDKSLRLNMHLLRQLNLDKAKSKMNILFLIKILEMGFLMIAIIWLTAFAFQYISSLRFFIPAFILDGVLIAVYIAAIVQLSIVIQLQLKKNTDAIAPLQKKVEKLKFLIVGYLKYSLFLIPLYPLMLIVAGKAYLKVDFFEPQRRAYLVSNIVVALAFLPISIWLFNELSKKVIEKKWVKQLLTGSGWHQAQAAQEFFNEIEKFEKE